ncbi:hypothetical protein RFI_28189 [Reticulomyxa filosa]|uniref:Uncharacterized protein n=1 Tax=Reticulomyxa filosa TaxID=46433 RepID=X6M6V4_RETFI|nr:hypothetical protein RFI_28189 [Reticulomyxa filosa]|eukprot:ETO09197.1 hypothetical protein RFI_28189 [Reticulomyxa filosa]
MINEGNEEESTIFHAEAATGQYELLQWIFDKCPELNVDQANHYDYTALHKAARNGQREAISWLLEYRVDISLITANGDRAEYEAMYDRVQAIRLSHPKQKLFGHEALKYYSDQLSMCRLEYETILCNPLLNLQLHVYWHLVI